MVLQVFSKLFDKYTSACGSSQTGDGPSHQDPPLTHRQKFCCGTEVLANSSSPSSVHGQLFAMLVTSQSQKRETHKFRSLSAASDQNDRVQGQNEGKQCLLLVYVSRVMCVSLAGRTDVPNSSMAQNCLAQGISPSETQGGSAGIDQKTHGGWDDLHFDTKTQAVSPGLFVQLNALRPPDNATGGEQRMGVGQCFYGFSAPDEVAKTRRVLRVVSHRRKGVHSQLCH